MTNGIARRGTEFVSNLTGLYMTVTLYLFYLFGIAALQTLVYVAQSGIECQFQRQLRHKHRRKGDIREFFN